MNAFHDLALQLASLVRSELACENQRSASGGDESWTCVERSHGDLSDICSPCEMVQKAEELIAMGKRIAEKASAS